MTSRSLVKLQWLAIAVLILAYIFKPNICPDIEVKPSRTVYVTMHDTVPVKDTTQAKKTGVRRKLKDMFVPADPVAGMDSMPTDSCDEYLATVSDSTLDIEVKWCSLCDVGAVEVTHRLKGVKSIHTIDSIPYNVGIKNALYLGAAVNIGNGFGPKIEWVNPKRAISYTFDAVQNQHLVGATFKLVGK